MDPSQAQCRPAPPSRPTPRPLFDPVEPPSPDQPLLPWPSPPEILDSSAVVAAPLRRTARDLTSALIETLASRRPIHQLEPWLHPDVCELITRLRSARSSRELRLLSVRVQQPRDNVVEVAAHLRQASGSRAAALRLTSTGERWQITELAIALDPRVVQDAGRPRRAAG